MPDPFSIEIRNKAGVYGVRHGYVMRGATAPSAIVLHTTNNAAPTSFAHELDFLFRSADVSAHHLVGKDGRIVQLLDPRGYTAYHAGGRQEDGTWTALPAFSNPNSIGIELHVSVGEQPTAIQLDATGWLVKRLAKQFTIPDQLIETHRKIALPKGRKSDPEGWPDVDFYAWRTALFAAPPPSPAVVTHYTVKGLPIYQKQNRTGPVAGYLAAGEAVAVDVVYGDGAGHLSDGRGFVDLAGLAPD